VIVQKILEMAGILLRRVFGPFCLDGYPRVTSLHDKVDFCFSSRMVMGDLTITEV